MRIIKLSKNKKNYKSKDKIFTGISIESDIRTIEKLCEGHSICRFGDGEFNLIFGGSIKFQPFRLELASRLKEILTSRDDILVAIPKAMKRDYSNYNDFAYRFWNKYYRKNIIKISKILDKNKFYYSSQVTRFYIDAEDKRICDKYIEMFKEIWKEKNLLIIEGKQTRMGVGNDLFSKAHSVKRILCPAEDAFDKYEMILKECLKFDKDCVVLIALGPTATVLAYDLSKNGYQALDIGHIDIEYEWYLKRAKEKTKIQNKYVNEAGGYSGVEEIEDLEYKNSIVNIIE